MAESAQKIYSSPEKVVEDIYSQLNAFRSASEQLAEQAKLGKLTIDGWKTLTINFANTAESTQKGINTVVETSAETVNLAKEAQVEIRKIADDLRPSKLHEQLDELDRQQKVILEHITELQDKNQQLFDRALALISEHHKKQVLVQYGTLILLTLCFTFVLLVASQLFGHI